MSRATGLITRLNATLKRVNPVDRKVYKRLTVKSGGDALTGQAVTTVVTDTLLVPQPVYQRLGRNVVGDPAEAEQIMTTTGVNRIGVEYQILFSPTSVSIAELDNDNITYVFKDASGNAEVYRLTDYEPVALTGQDVLYIAYVRSSVR
jgi:hypothetical protein